MLEILKVFATVVGVVAALWGIYVYFFRFPSATCAVAGKSVREVLRAARSEGRQGDTGLKQYLFAYGTLAENAPQEIAGAVNQLKSVGDGFIFGRLYDLGEYPGAVLDQSKWHKVFGKVFEMPRGDSLLERLDNYEGFDPRRPATSLFVRRRTTINRHNQRTLTGWVYEYQGDVSSAPLIKSGYYSKIFV